MALVVRIIFLCVLVASPWVALAQESPSATPPVARRPTAAFIDLDRSPFAAVLEAELLAGTVAEWVERSEIDKILDEQKLQAMFSPEAGEERAQLGRLLKADVLVFVQKGTAENVPYLDMVVSEVSRGLRLISRRVPLSEDVQQDVTRNASGHATKTPTKAPERNRADPN